MISRLFAALSVTVAASAWALAQEPMPAGTSPLRTEPPASGATTSLGHVSPTPEMWFYEQAMRQYNDPKAAVRRKAEFQAEQRLRRIAAMQWFGFSNARPTVNHTPFTSSYSPSWVGNGYDPNFWVGVAPQPVIVQPIVAPVRPVYGLW